MTIALDALASTFTRGTTSEPWRDGELVVTPWTFRDGEPVVLYVHQPMPEGYVVSDRGQSSDSLMLAEVDLARKDVLRSWDAVRRSIDMDQPFPVPGSQWELAATSDLGSLGAAMSAVAAAALRADGLKALARTRVRGKRFGDWVIQSASEAGLAVTPLAPITTPIGVSRKVSALLEGDKRKAYVQAVGDSQDPWEAYDRSRSVFMDSGLPSDEKFTIVAEDSRLTSVQLAGIKQHSEVVLEADAMAMFRSLNAA